jgi:hypothetical protein
MQIPLTRDQVTCIGEEDADLAKFKWNALKLGSPKNPLWYAVRSVKKPGGRYNIVYLHRIILERKIGRALKKGEHCDHIDRDSLNNDRNNLHAVTMKQNACNARKYAGSTSSRYKGVSYAKDRLKWRASICIEGKVRHLGYFDLEKDAADAYANAEVIRAKQLEKE